MMKYSPTCTYFKKIKIKKKMDKYKIKNKNGVAEPPPISPLEFCR
jgi:hypothetical protein